MHVQAHVPRYRLLRFGGGDRMYEKKTYGGKKGLAFQADTHVNVSENVKKQKRKKQLRTISSFNIHS